MKYWLLRALVAIGGRLPARLTHAIAAVAGTAAWWASPSLRRVARSHMRHVMGEAMPAVEVDRLARQCVRSNFYYYADFARAPRVTGADVFESMDYAAGLDTFFEAQDRGGGVILFSAHLGAGEVLAQAAAPFGLCMAVITEPLSPPRVHEFVHEVRGAHGVRFLPATSGGLRQAIGHLRAGATLGGLVDRDVLGGAEAVPFFGEPAPIPSGLVELARRTGAPMLAAWIPRTTPGRFALHLEPVPLPEPTGDRAADVASGMAAMVEALEGGIRRWPGQWFALSPIWASDADAGPTSR